MRYAICYISNCVLDVKHSEIEDLLQICRENNISMDVNGILLFSEGNFFQILEGDKNNVLNVFEKIQNDKRHQGIIQLIGKNIEDGSCEGYLVDIIDASSKYISKVPQAYIEALECIPATTRKPIERMLKVFIAP